MKTQDQKHNDKFFKRIARWWIEDIDLEEILANFFFVLIIAGALFGFICMAVHNFHKDKTTNSDLDTVAVVEEQVVITKKQCRKSCAVDWDLDTVTVLAPNEKGYKLHFKGKVPYYLTIENLDDTIQ